MNFKENWLGILITSILIGLVAHSIIYSYFNKKIVYRTFEECLTTIINEGNWNTRKGTVEYCIEQAK